MRTFGFLAGVSVVIAGVLFALTQQEVAIRRTPHPFQASSEDVPAPERPSYRQRNETLTDGAPRAGDARPAESAPRVHRDPASLPDEPAGGGAASVTPARGPVGASSNENLSTDSRGSRDPGGARVVPKPASVDSLSPLAAPSRSDRSLAGDARAPPGPIAPDRGSQAVSARVGQVDVDEHSRPESSEHAAARRARALASTRPPVVPEEPPPTPGHGEAEWLAAGPSATEVRWQPFWGPFTTLSSARGFAETVAAKTDLDIRAVESHPGAYKVAFPYSSDNERSALKTLIEERTGLTLELR